MQRSRTRTRSEPLRTCVGCRQTKPKRQLVRVVRTPDGHLELDRRGKMSGRGAYLCPDNSCWDVARKRHSLDRGLDVKLSSDDWEHLLQGRVSYDSSLSL